MRSVGLSLCGFALAVVSVQAANPEATVTSAAPFKLRGAIVPVAGVPSWPLLKGDEIATESSSAAIQFTDGSAVTIGQNSSARLEKTANDALVFRLLKGSMDVKPATGSRIGYYSQNQPLSTTPGKVTTASAGVRPMAAPPPPPPPPNSPPPPSPVSKR